MVLSTAQSYRDAAKEHLGRADRLFENNEYFLAHYIAGLAVECHLRAYVRRATKEFDSRHDLNGLAKESGFYDLVPLKQVESFSVKFSILNARWRSNHRYFSERQFLDYMNEPNAMAQEDFQARGNKWKNLSRTVLNLAHEIINLGEAKWDQ
ncbi:MAG: hypothetical protein OHK0029_39280 [Armatimonadaceae bacterium]